MNAFDLCPISQKYPCPLHTTCPPPVPPLPRIPHVCPKCEGMTTENGLHPAVMPTAALCPTCGGSGVVWESKR